MPLSDRDLVEEVRALVRGVMGRSAPVTGVEPLQLRPDAAVLLVTIAGGRGLVVKLAGRRATHPVDYERTAMLTGLARSLDVPVPDILAADDSFNDRRWRYLIAEHIDGIPWRQLRPRLAADQVAAVHRQLAAALLAVQSVVFAGFGELDRSGQPPAGSGPGHRPAPTGRAADRRPGGSGFLPPPARP
jgi:Phosphotransferase enzyme family